VIFKFFRDHDTPQPPLAGRLVGLSVGVLLLSFAVYVAMDVLAALLSLVVPFLAVVVIYAVMVGRMRRR
jgi:hypothetical protein